MPIRFEMLNCSHDRKSFVCKDANFNEWLLGVALNSQAAGMCKVWVALNDDNVIVGYYSLSSWVIPLDLIPEGTFKKTPKQQQISAALIGKLATAQAYEGRGIGRGMIYDAAHRLELGPMGVNCIALHALKNDPKLLKWYLKTGFMPLKDQTHYLFLPMSRIMATIATFDAQQAALTSVPEPSAAPPPTLETE